MKKFLIMISVLLIGVVVVSIGTAIIQLVGSYSVKL